MRTLTSLFVFCLASITLSSCSTYSSYGSSDGEEGERHRPYNPSDFESRMPQQIHTREKVVVVNPRVHAWGAYDSNGSLVKGGMATAGSGWCPDLGRPCRTRSGSFRVMSLGDPDCKSHIFPLPEGGAPMPYCMFFNQGQALHGSNEVVDGNVSHGCVRLHVEDAAWLRYNFVGVGTKVVVEPYG